MNNPIFFNYFTGNEMFLNDPLEYFRCTGVIPDAFGVDNSDGASIADSEAVGFGSPDLDEALETELIGPFFQIGPSFEPFFLGAAFGDALITAEKEMPASPADSQIPGSHLEF